MTPEEAAETIRLLVYNLNAEHLNLYHVSAEKRLMGILHAFAEAVNGTAQTDYFAQAPWWITVSGGQIVKIEQQYIP